MLSRIIRSSFVFFLAGIAFASIAFGQESDKLVTAPPIAGLLPITHPEIESLEGGVRTEIIKYRNELTEKVKNVGDSQGLATAYGNMARVYHGYEFLETAADCYRNAATLAPDNYRWIYLAGKVAQQQNDFYKAVDLFKKTTVMAPEYGPAFVNLGIVYFELDLMGLSYDSYIAALKLQPRNPAAFYGLGQIELSRKNYQKAAEYFENVLKLVPEANRVHYTLALAYRGLGETEKAKAQIEKQGPVGIKPADPIFDELEKHLKGARIRVQNGISAMQAGRFKDAEEEFRLALESEPENVSALINRGATLVKLGRPDEAADQFQRALEVEPENTNARFNLAILMDLKGDYFTAIGHYKKLLQQEPKDLETRYRLGVSLFRANLLREAASELLVVYKAKPDSEPVALELARLFVQVGEHKQAKDILIRSYQTDSKRIPTIAALSFLLSSSPDRSLREGEKALALSQLIYKATGALEHGAIVSNSLAELGKCDESEKLLRNLIDKADAVDKKDLALKLKNELDRFSNGNACRP